ncbi:hypothetical protein INT82_15510 [Mannheimia haemolytica]|nr:hypothetical protein [Mannheimia haemolytica]
MDYWEEHWSEELKRETIIRSFEEHRRKAQQVQCEGNGISAMLLKSVSGLRKKRQRQPGTFRVFVELKDKGIVKKSTKLERLIEDAKPVSRHITELAVSASKANIFSGAHSGEIITIYPPKKGSLLLSLKQNGFI